MQNGKSSAETTQKKGTNDDNWKLLKFLCDRIEEKKKKEITTPRQAHHKIKAKKPIPNTPKELLKKRRKSKKKRNKVRESVSTRIQRSSHSTDGLHKKTKSALYTSAITKANFNSPTRTSTAGSKPSFFFKAHTPKRNHLHMEHPPPVVSIEHHKSHSSHLPHKYRHHIDPRNDTHSTSSSEISSTSNVLMPETSNPTNPSIRSTASASKAQISNFHFPLNNGRPNRSVSEHKSEKTKGDNTDQSADHALSDPVQSLVQLVRRVTQIYSNTNMDIDEKQTSDQETISHVYDEYVLFYGRPPVYPDHLKKFSHQYQDVHITYAGAKQYLDSVRAIEVVTSPRASTDDEAQRLSKLRTSRASMSTPMLSGMEMELAENAHLSPKITISLDGDGKSHEKNDRENLYAFYNLTELELLRRIKGKINAAIRNAESVEDAVSMVWDREYAEMEKRVHRSYLNPVHNRKALTSSLSFNHQQLKRDTTYKSLKQMSEATDIDDQDHDAAVYLLKTYFPDDEDDDILLDYHQHLVSTVHSQQHSAIQEESGTKLRINIQDKHIRSVTMDKPKKPTLYRRSTTRSIRQTEALSLYDSMVMKARETKILKKGKKFRDIPIPPHLKPTKSAPTTRKQPILDTINSQGDSESEEDQKLLHMINDMHGGYHEPFKLDDDLEVIVRHDINITPEPPLFDAAFRQLTTGSLFDDDFNENETDGEFENENEKALSISKQTTFMSASSSESADLVDSTSRNGHSHNNRSRLNNLPNNLLHIMAKYGDKMESWDFDVFEFMDDPALCGKGLVLCSFYLFRKTGLLDATGIAQANLWRFLEHVEMGYLVNPYHNKYHAVDVLLSTHFMFGSPVFQKHMTIWDQFGAYIAAVCHDLGHMGLNNAWYINTAGNLALLYGDESVLENYHIAETFRILNDSKNNWMLPFPSSVRRYLATVIRRSILATDLKVHGTKMIQLQNMVDIFKNNTGTHEGEFNADNITLWRCESIANYASLDNIMLDNFPLFIDEKRNEEWIRDVVVKDLDIDNSDDDDDDDLMDANHDNRDVEPRKPRVVDVDDERIFLLEITIHACDVANPCKPIHIAKEWADRYLKEAFNQGDMERNIGIPVSAGMDRYTSKLPTSQIGFITFIVKRLFLLYSEIVDVSKHCVQIMLQNEQYWIQERKKMQAAKQQKKAVSHLGTINE